MCGRYCITSAPEADPSVVSLSRAAEFPASLQCRADPAGADRAHGWKGERQFALVRWGLIPAWVKDPKDFTLLINARGESVNDKPAFRNAMKRRRCLFPADGFYEWKPVRGGKRPYFARPRAGGPIAFAGLWETWIGPERRGDGNRRDRHHGGQRGDGRDAPSRAGDRAAGAVRFLARLRRTSTRTWQPS